MKGSVSARHTENGLEVRCSCDRRFTLPKDGGERTCDCGTIHHYDGKQLLSTPRGLEAVPPDPRRQPPHDPRRARPPRGETKPL